MRAIRFGIRFLRVAPPCIPLRIPILRFSSEAKSNTDVRASKPVIPKTAEKKMISSFLTSFIPNKWQHDQVGPEWISWLEQICQFKDFQQTLNIVAHNKEEFVHKIKIIFPYLTCSDLSYLYSKINPNLISKKVPSHIPSDNYIDYIDSVDSVDFASPPLLSTRACELISLSQATRCNLKTQTVYSIKNEFNIRSTFMAEIDSSLFGKSALNYSKNYWGDILYDCQKSISQKEYIFADPNAAENQYCGGAKYIFSLSKLFSPEIKINNPSKVIMITHLKAIADEINWKGLYFVSSPKSVHTGGSLNKDGCPVTGVKFPEEKYHTYGGKPIDLETYNYLKSHEKEIREHFKIDLKFNIVPSKELHHKAFCVFNESQAKNRAFWHT